jgi:hypothetical protein
VISCRETDAAAVLEEAEAHGVPARRIGSVTPGPSGIRISGAGTTLSAGTDALADGYFAALARIMDQAPAGQGASR